MFVLVAALLIAVFLPREIKLEQKAEINGSIKQARHLLFDIKQWPQLMAWEQFTHKAKVHISSPSNTLGANAFLQTLSTEIEISITKLTPDTLQYSLLLNNEHSLFGQFTLLETNNHVELHHTLHGTIHSTVIGGMVVLYIQSLADKIFKSSVNNLNSQLRLKHKEIK